MLSRSLAFAGDGKGFSFWLWYYFANEDLNKMSIYENVKPIDLAEIKTYELASRPSKVTVADFAASPAEHDTLRDFLGYSRGAVDA